MYSESRQCRRETRNQGRPGAAERLARRIAAVVTAVIIAFGAAGAVSVQADAYGNEWAVYEYLTGTLGFNTAAACGIMANIRCESGFAPGARSGSGAYGLCQWMGGRKSGMQSWCRRNGFSSGSLEGQLSYTYYELSTYYPDVLWTLQNVEESSDGAYTAGYTWCMYYERPANAGSVSDYRGSLATGYWSTYSIYVIDQWLEYEDGKHYIRDGQYLTDCFAEIEEKTYYFDENSVMQTGFRTVDDKKYYLGDDGVMRTGWQEIDEEKYYFDKDGVMQTGEFKVDGQTFHADKDGKIVAIAAVYEVQEKILDAAGQSVSPEEAEEPVTEPITALPVQQ